MTSARREQVKDFGPKLRLTRAALGAATQKDLAAAFLARNPGTAFDLMRSYKWMQGRTLPRATSLLTEWASLLDVGQNAAWLATCDLQAFTSAVAKRYGRDAADLMREARLGESADTAASAQRDSVGGIFACYSLAQSPFYSGRTVRASMVITQAPRSGELLATSYTQRFAGRTACARGAARLHGQTIALMLDDVPEGLAPIAMMLFRPTPPASVLAGMMMGAAALHPGLQPPYATRILAVRLPETAEALLTSSDRYLDRGMDDVIADLAELGVMDGSPCGPRSREELKGYVEACLGAGSWTGSDKFGVDAYLALAAAFDRLWIDRLEHRDAGPRGSFLAVGEIPT